jgi:hypothetical protein
LCASSVSTCVVLSLSHRGSVDDVNSCLFRNLGRIFSWNFWNKGLQKVVFARALVLNSCYIAPFPYTPIYTNKFSPRRSRSLAKENPRRPIRRGADAPGSEGAVSVAFANDPQAVASTAVPCVLLDTRVPPDFSRLARKRNLACAPCACAPPHQPAASPCRPPKAFIEGEIIRAHWSSHNPNLDSGRRR